MVDLESQYLKMVKNILQKNLSREAKVFVFGSRANNKAKKFSDLDLAISTPREISLTVFANLRSSFEESDLPYKVDIIDLNAIDQSFRKNIEPDLIMIWGEEL
jgi:predicted nucleotidyltransferase